MCLGIPMQVIEIQPGHALCSGRGEQRRVRTALTGDVGVGGWVLVFLDSALQTLSPERAAEIDATLDLLEAAQAGAEGAERARADAAFELPSQMSREAVQALAGQGPGPSTLTHDDHP